ncbi:MAG: phosphoribosylformylglycinamidine synthase subunit PurS [Euryarchaeota archaeon]|nr:phosphoribosylformylglycinamidine synthase subunit PurS [Euryarchaeota archaeon]
MYRAVVRVGLKKGVTDPEGKNTKKALELLGFPGLKAVRAEKLYAIELDAPDEAAAKQSADEMCRKLLTNPVIHNYTITIERVP